VLIDANSSIGSQAADSLLIVTHGVPHSSKGASAVVFHLYIEAMKKRYKSITHLVVTDDHPNSILALSNYAGAAQGDESFEVISAKLSHFVDFSLRSFSWRAKTPSLELLSTLSQLSPQKIVCFDVLAAAITKEVPCKDKVIWLGDLRYQTVVFHGVYDFILNPANLTAIPKAIASSLAWKRLYRRTLRGEGKVIASSKSAELSLNKNGLASSYLPYPWPDEGTQFELRLKREIPSFIMFGNLAALGSKSALLFLLRRVHPLLVRYWGEGGFRVLIAGISDMPAWVIQEVKNRPEFELLGFVPDLASEVGSCHAVLAPISAPVGNRTRIVTAMSMRSLVIAHTSTALGNPALVSGENCFLAKRPDEFVQFMIRAFENQAEARVIAHSARGTYERVFHPSIASHKLIELLES